MTTEKVFNSGSNDSGFFSRAITVTVDVYKGNSIQNDKFQVRRSMFEKKNRKL